MRTQLLSEESERSLRSAIQRPGKLHETTGAERLAIGKMNPDAPRKFINEDRARQSGMTRLLTSTAERLTCFIFRFVHGALFGRPTNP
jgi:hypothetical protein